MFSIIYTPTEGEAIQNFSRLFRRPEGCFLNILDQDRVHDNLAQWRSPEAIDYIVVSDGEEVYVSEKRERWGNIRSDNSMADPWNWWPGRRSSPNISREARPHHSALVSTLLERCLLFWTAGQM